MISRCQVAWRPEDFASVDVHSLPDVSGLLVEAPVALAYMGPGAGLAAIGALLAAVGVILREKHTHVMKTERKNL